MLNSIKVTKASTHLFVITASQARLAVVFRRGPGRLTQLLLWNLDNDIFQTGQWFKGVLHAKSCDLSPNGKYLVYYAGNYKPPFYKWVAISRPPYLTALALWPNAESLGGGIFQSDNHLAILYQYPLDYLPSQYSLPANFQVTKLQFDSYSSENIFKARMIRDGWTESLETWNKNHRDFCLKMRKEKIPENSRDQSLENCQIIGLNGDVVFAVDACEWADWDTNGDLLYARKGLLLRLPQAAIDIGESKILTDLNDNVFEALESPHQYRGW